MKDKKIVIIIIKTSKSGYLYLTLKHFMLWRYFFFGFRVKIWNDKIMKTMTYNITNLNIYKFQLKLKDETQENLHLVILTHSEPNHFASSGKITMNPVQNVSLWSFVS